MPHSGATRGTGGPGLAAHLADHQRHNSRTLLGETRLVEGGTIEEAMADLDACGPHTRARQTTYHVHLDPAPHEQWTEEAWRDAWSRYERDLGLEEAPFVEVRHWTWRRLVECEPEDISAGEEARRVGEDTAAWVDRIDIERLREIHGEANVRDTVNDGTGAREVYVLMEHRHRAVSRINDDGTANPLRNDFYIRQRIDRELEHDHGWQLQRGAHNRLVIRWLREECGRPDVADAMEAAGLHEGARQVAETPQQRLRRQRKKAQAARRGKYEGEWLDADLGKHLVLAWDSGAQGADFLALFQDGRSIVMGDRAICVMDEQDEPYGLQRQLKLALKAAGRDDRIRKRDVDERVGNVALRTVEQEKAARADLAAKAIASIRAIAEEQAALRIAAAAGQMIGTGLAAALTNSEQVQGENGRSRSGQNAAQAGAASAFDAGNDRPHPQMTGGKDDESDIDRAAAVLDARGEEGTGGRVPGRFGRAAPGAPGKTRDHGRGGYAHADGREAGTDPGRGGPSGRARGADADPSDPRIPGLHQRIADGHGPQSGTHPGRHRIRQLVAANRLNRGLDARRAAQQRDAFKALVKLGRDLAPQETDAVFTKLGGLGGAPGPGAAPNVPALVVEGLPFAEASPHADFASEAGSLDSLLELEACPEPPPPPPPPPSPWPNYARRLDQQAAELAASLRPKAYRLKI